MADFEGSVLVVGVPGSMNVPALGYAFFDDEKLVRARPSWRMLLEHCVRRPASRAALTAGRRRPTRIPMMLITTNSSISVKPVRRRRRLRMVRSFLSGA